MSRTKGSSFERDVAKELFLLTGVSFRRNLTQYQTSAGYDLTADDSAWPFAIECKRYAAGSGCAPAWRIQAQRAAELKNLIPAVVYRFDRQPVRVSVPYTAFSAAVSAAPLAVSEWAEISLQGFAVLASEIMSAGEEQ